MNLTFTLIVEETEFVIDEPAGFDGITFKTVRNDLHGFYSTFSEQSIEFYCGKRNGLAGGAELVRAQYQEHGTDAEVSILIDRKSVV